MDRASVFGTDSESTETTPKQGDTAGGSPANSAYYSAQAPNRPEIPRELGEVIDAWADLPEAVKAGILAMVKAAKG